MLRGINLWIIVARSNVHLQLAQRDEDLRLAKAEVLALEKHCRVRHIGTGLDGSNSFVIIEMG